MSPCAYARSQSQGSPGKGTEVRGRPEMLYPSDTILCLSDQIFTLFMPSHCLSPSPSSSPGPRLEWGQKARGLSALCSQHTRHSGEYALKHNPAYCVSTVAQRVSICTGNGPESSCLSQMLAPWGHSPWLQCNSYRGSWWLLAWWFGQLLPARFIFPTHTICLSFLAFGYFIFFSFCLSSTSVTSFLYETLSVWNIYCESYLPDLNPGWYSIILYTT